MTLQSFFLWIFLQLGMTISEDQQNCFQAPKEQAINQLKGAHTCLLYTPASSFAWARHLSTLGLPIHFTCSFCFSCVACVALFSSLQDPQTYSSSSGSNGPAEPPSPSIPLRDAHSLSLGYPPWPVIELTILYFSSPLAYRSLGRVLYSLLNPLGKWSLYSTWPYFHFTSWNVVLALQGRLSVLFMYP